MLGWQTGADGEHAAALEEALRAAAAIAFQWDPATGVVGCAGATALLRLPPGARQLSFDELLARIHPPDRDRVRADLARAQLSGCCLSRFRLDQPEGWRWMQAHGSLRTAATGPVLAGVMQVAADPLASLRDNPGGPWAYCRAEQLDPDELRAALRRSEQEYEALFELAGTGMAQVETASGRYLRVNRRLCELTGYRADELTGMTFYDLTHPDDRDADWSAYREMVEGRSATYDREKRYIRKDGTVIWVHVSASTISDPDAGPWRSCAVVHDITACKQAELAWREMEGRFRAAVRTMPVTVFDTDERLRYTWVYNPGGGFTPERMLGHSDSELIGAENAAELESIKAAVLASRRGSSGEIRLTINGRDYWFDYALEPRHGVSGRVTGLTGAAIDVTRRHALEQALRENEQRLNLALSLGGAGIWDWPMDGDTLFWSESHFQMLGYAPDPEGKATYAMWSERVHPDDLAGVLQSLASSRDRRENYACTYRILRAGTGELRWMEASGRFLYDGSGQPVRMLGVLRDVTDREAMATALQASEARLRAILEANPIGVILGDIHGNVYDANDAFLRIIGYSRDDLQAGRIRWTDVTPPEYLPIDAQAIVEARQRGACTPYEKMYVRRDGTRVPVFVGYTLLGEEREKSAAFILDLTEEKRARDALEATLAEKSRLLEERETLLREINHRIKNSLQLVSSMLRLQSGGDLDDSVRRQLLGAERRVLAIAKLHEHLYRRPDRVSRIEADRYLRELCAGLADAIFDPALHLDLTFQADPIELDTDQAIQLALALNELITNAAKHAFVGRTGLAGAIEVRLQRLPDGRITLTVADDGAGLPAEFDISQGTGLGMRLLQALVGALGAELEIDRGAKGSRFIIILPVD